jgi:hypothetical protein
VLNVDAEKWRHPLPNRTAPFVKPTAPRYKNSRRFHQPPSAAELKAAHDLFAPTDPYSLSNGPDPQYGITQVCDSIFGEYICLIVENWLPAEKGNLRGFFDLTIQPLNIVIRDMCLHEDGGKRWISFPGKAQIDANGQLRKIGGKTQYVSIVQVQGEQERDAFKRMVLAALDNLFATPA